MRAETKISLLAWMALSPFGALVVSIGGITRWWPTPGVQLTESPTLLKTGLACSLVASVTATLVLAANFAVPALRSRGWPGTAGLLRLALFLPAFAIPIARVGLPWEEPETGEGSPMASLISIAAMGCCSTVAFFIPCAALWIGEGRERLRRDGEIRG